MINSGSARSGVDGLPRHEQDRDWLREQPMRNERQCLSGRLVQPLSIVDHTEQWLLLGKLRQETEGRDPDQEAIRCYPSTQPERDA